jgi:hypothetical protein
MSVKLLAMVFDRYPGGPGERLLALAMADYARDDGSEIRPSVAALCKKRQRAACQLAHQAGVSVAWLRLPHHRVDRRGPGGA